MATQLNQDGLTYEKWTQRVDALVMAQVGLGINDCSDWPQMQCFEDEFSPQEGALSWGECQDNLPPDVLDALVAGCNS